MSVKGESSRQPAAPILVGEIDKNLKVKVPDSFSGERSKLRGFLIQVDLYLTFNNKRFASDTERILWVVTLLQGAALNWIEGFVQDYLENTNKYGQISNDTMEDKTVEIFSTWKGFVKNIKATFGEVDEHRTAERAIQTLKQRGAATTYTAEFQRYSTKTGWNDDALRAQYYRGLKDGIKDELLRRGKPNSLEALIKLAVEIDNRFYERSLEKKGLYDTGHSKRYSQPQGNNQQKNHWPQPMELDATGRKELSPQDRQKHMQDRTCFNCGKPGHMARNCKTDGGLRRNTGRRRELNATTLTGRGGYSGRMQLNATMQGPLSATLQEPPSNEAFEEVTQSMEAISLVETLGIDVNSEPSDTESSVGSEMFREEFMMAQILAGAETAKQENKLKKLREEENVARIDHPRHVELAWSLCYTDSCTIHSSSKIGSGYWPKKIKPVYWERKPRYSANTTVAQGESSKN